MERLTNIGSNGEIWITDNDETRRFGRKESAYKKLAEYEDLEEQGLLLRLPCKVGDTVYFIYHNEVHHEEVKRFFQCNGGKNWGIVLWGMYPDLYFDQIGKTVFLTQAEAEQQLKEIEND